MKREIDILGIDIDNLSQQIHDKLYPDKNEQPYVSSIVVGHE